MSVKSIFIAIATIAAIGICACVQSNTNSTDIAVDEHTTVSNKQKVVELLKSLETGDSNAVKYIDQNKYIQHNLSVADGYLGFMLLREQLPANSVKVNTIRVLEDGNFVVAHSDYDFLGPKVGFDIFRFENGKIVEHWDNLQPTANPNPSRRSMIDGAIEITDQDKTAANKALVKSFVENILISGKVNELTSYFDGDNYIQHNPQVADKVSGLTNALKEWAQQGITPKYSNMHMVLGEGNFVLAVSEGSISGQPTAFYDLFRVENGKIAEHWDVIEPIPAKENWKNSNGKF